MAHVDFECLSLYVDVRFTPHREGKRLPTSRVCMCAYSDWPLPYRPVQLGWTCQECKTPTDVALGVIEAGKPSHHFKVHAPGDGLTLSSSDIDFLLLLLIGHV